jgi:hypothetical protein
VQVLSLAATNADIDAELFKAFADIGYFPKWVVLDVNNYDPAMITEGGASLDQFKGGVLVISSFVPFELGESDPAKYPATAQFVNVVRQYQNVAPKALGVYSWSAWLLFAEAVKSCGSDVTRQCVLNYAQSLTNWTAGGLTGPVEAEQRHRGLAPVRRPAQGDVEGLGARHRRLQAQSGHLQLRPGQRVQADGLPTELMMSGASSSWLAVPVAR